MDSQVKFLIYILTVLSVLSPVIFVAIRESVKRQRQEIITDLADVFDVDAKNALHLIPSFEFVKYKYFVGGRRSNDPEVAGSEAARRAMSAAGNSRKREDYSTLSWLIGCVSFSAVVGVSMFYGASMVLYVLLIASGKGAFNASLWPDILYPETRSSGMVYILSICAAFAGSYIMALRNLHRAIKNFDLSPGTIVSEAIKILTAQVLGFILAVALFEVGGAVLQTSVNAIAGGASNIAGSNTVSAGAVTVLTLCFVAGIMPDVALRFIVQRDQLKNFKQEENDIFKAFKITPIEIIDGIDSDIRARLDDHHIHSTQNLAAANPLMLFVETPFGVYQIMDWVAQAQLCCSVGRDKIVKLWPYGIRTLFDLERLAGGAGPENDALLVEVGRVMLGTGLIPADVADRAVTAALVKRSIQLRLDDPHVQRLRQIYIAVGDRLGSKSRRFRSNGYRILCRGRGRKAWFCRGLRAA